MYSTCVYRRCTRCVPQVYTLCMHSRAQPSAPNRRQLHWHVLQSPQPAKHNASIDDAMTCIAYSAGLPLLALLHPLPGHRLPPAVHEEATQRTQLWAITAAATANAAAALTARTKQRPRRASQASQ